VGPGARSPRPGARRRPRNRLCGVARRRAPRGESAARGEPAREDLNWTEFPSTGSEFQAYRSFQTHELDVLLRLSGQEARIKQNHFPLWNAVAIWKVESRYNVVGTVQQPDATAMIQAAEELVAVL